MPEINLNITHTHNVNINPSASSVNTNDFMRGDELIRSFEDSVEKFSQSLTKNSPNKQLFNSQSPEDKAKDKLTKALNNDVIKRLGSAYLSNPHGAQKYLNLNLRLFQLDLVKNLIHHLLMNQSQLKQSFLANEHTALINAYKKGIVTQNELNTNLKKLNDNLGKGDSQYSNRLKDGLRIAMGASVLGAMVAFGNTIAEKGAIQGRESESLNTSPFQAPNLAQNYATQLIQNNLKLKTIASAGIGSLIGGVLGSLLGPAGTIAGLGLGYVGSSFFNSSLNREGTQQIGLNDFRLNQDNSAFQLRNMLNLPTSSFGGVSIDGKNYPTQISNIQQSMLQNPQLSPYVSLIPSMLLNANRRYNFKDIPSSAQNVFNTARLMGIDANNLPSFVNSATTLASASNKPLSQVLTEMVSDNKNYGGNIMKNTAQMVELLQTTNLGYNQARELVNRYQYNQPALKNILGVQTSTPLNIAISRALMSIIPNSTAQEMQTLMFNPNHLATYRTLQKNATLNSKQLPETILMDMIYGRTNQNINTNQFATMSAKSGVMDLTNINSQSTSAIKIMSDMLKSTLANVSIQNQTVKATNVYIDKLDSDALKSPPSTWDIPLSAPNHSSSGTNNNIVVPPLVRR